MYRWCRRSPIASWKSIAPCAGDLLSNSGRLKPGMRSVSARPRSAWNAKDVQMVPEISDRIVEIDRAMRWGFAFQLGPFETWDALGFRETAERMEREGCTDGAGDLRSHRGNRSRHALGICFPTRAV